jgi:hypothetical protein
MMARNWEHTTVRLSDTHRKFVKRYSKDHPDWNLSQFVRDKIDDLMHASPNQIMEMIEEKQKLKQDVNGQIDKEITRLQQEYETAYKRDQEIKQKLITDRRTDYGGLEKKDGGN